MRILLDTHVYLWCLTNDKHLTKRSKKIITDADEVYVSAASIWEIAIKVKLGKLDTNVHKVVEAIAASGFSELAVTTQHALMVSEVPEIHRDPFDRILIAQTLSEPLRLITADKILQKYSELVDVI